MHRARGERERMSESLQKDSELIEILVYRRGVGVVRKGDSV